MSKLTLIHVLGPRKVDPGYGQPATPPRPGHELPTPPVKPGHELPTAPGHPSNPIVLPPEIWPPEPTSPPTIDNTLPEAETPPLIPTTLPVFPPAGDWTKPVEPNQRFELKWSPVYGWVLIPVKDSEKPQPKGR